MYNFYIFKNIFIKLYMKLSTSSSPFLPRMELARPKKIWWSTDQPAKQWNWVEKWENKYKYPSFSQEETHFRIGWYHRPPFRTPSSCNHRTIQSRSHYWSRCVENKKNRADSLFIVVGKRDRYDQDGQDFHSLFYLSCTAVRQFF